MNLKKITHYAVLIVIACIFLVPLLYVFYNSLLPYRYVQTWAPIDVWTLDNYKELFQKYPILQWYWNTFVSTVIVVVGNLVFPVMAGYALAKLRFPGRKLIFSILLISMMVPFQLMMIQMYIMLAKMNMHNTIWAITLPFLSQTMYLFIARQFFYSVPDELIEAARIDGVSHAGAFSKLYVLCQNHFMQQLRFLPLREHRIPIWCLLPLSTGLKNLHLWLDCRR